MRKATVGRARALRRSSRYTEQRLWRLLRDRRFVCLRRRLVIEADGPFHDPVRDAERDAWLASKGFRVLRFANAVVEERVSDAILAAVEVPRAFEHL